jgi:2-C-methyl-D-erythritol 2,4-cyclodiphosphate synthase
MIDLRVGCGYDVHAFASDRPLVLGGVRIEHERGLAGHSDADVLTHAIVDALLGAVGWGDIGDRFGVDDPRHRDAESLGFLDEVTAELRQGGWQVINIDSTIIAQEPRIAGKRLAIRERLAQRLGLELSQVSVKATTPDHLGSIGRAEGIAAQAVVLLQSISTASQELDLADHP